LPYNYHKRLAEESMSFGITASSTITGNSPTGDSPFSDAVLASNPTVFLTLNETSGTVAADSSGNGRDGTYDNILYPYQPAIVADSPGNSIRFENGGGNGNQSITVPYGSWMDTPEMTVMIPCIVVPYGITVLASRYGEPGIDWSWFVYCDAGTGELRFSYQSDLGVTTSIGTGFVPNLNHKYFIAAYAGASGTGIRIYAATGLKASATGAGVTLGSSSRNLKLMSVDTGGYSATGYLDDFALFDSVLPTSVLDNMANLALVPQSTPWVTRSYGVNPHNGSSTQTINFTPANAGSLLVAVVSTPLGHSMATAGWTGQLSVTDVTEISVFTRSASAGESSFQISMAGSDLPLHFAVYEFAAGSTWAGGAAGVPGGHDFADTTGLPGTPLTFFAATSMRRWAADNPGGTYMVWNYFWDDDWQTETLYDGVRDGVYTDIAYIRKMSYTTGSPNFPAQQWAMFNGNGNFQTLTFGISPP
jgi:hypothetical protein